MKAPAGPLLELEKLCLKCKQNNKWWRRKPHQKGELGGLALLSVILVHLGSCLTKHLRRAYKEENDCPHSSGSWKSEIRVPAWSGEGPLTWQKGRTINPFTRAPISWPNDLPKAPPTNTITFGARVWIREGDTDIQTRADVQIPVKLDLAMLYFLTDVMTIQVFTI